MALAPKVSTCGPCSSLETGESLRSAMSALHHHMLLSIFKCLLWRCLDGKLFMGVEVLVLESWWRRETAIPAAHSPLQRPIVYLQPCTTIRQSTIKAAMIEAIRCHCQLSFSR